MSWSWRTCKHSVHSVDLLLDGDADGLCHRLRIGSGIYGTDLHGGGVMSGYWAMGRMPSVTSPATTMSSANTVAKIGRSMKNFENIGFGINQFILVVNGMYFIPSLTFISALVT